MIPFRVYYDGNATYAGDPYLAPAFGVLLIVEFDPDNGRHIISNGDYYVWEGFGWCAVDYMGLVDYLQRPGYRKVMFGRTVPNSVWYDTWRRADCDPDFPVRTAFGAHERVVSHD